MEIVRAKDPSVVFLADILTEEARLEFIRNSIIFLSSVGGSEGG